MEKSQQELAKRLLYLPIDLHEKVLLWLAYKGLKPVSEITAQKRNSAHLRKMMRDKEYRASYKSDYSFESAKSKRIRKWIEDAGMYISTEPNNNISWHVSRDKTKAELSAKILHKFDYDNELRSGQLFGYPENSAIAYAKDRIKKDDKTSNLIGTGHLLYENQFLKNKDYIPYIFYNMPKDKVEQDSQTAKKWAETIRKDVPTLSKWFERKAARRRITDEKISKRESVSSTRK